MSTKGERKQKERRRLRRKENTRSKGDAPAHDTLIGRACRRFWGGGKEK